MAEQAGQAAPLSAGNIPGRVELEGGAHVTVRRIPQSVKRAVMKAIGYGDGSTVASQDELLEVLVQWGVVAGEGLRDVEGAPVPVKRAKRPPLGEMCGVEVSDAIAAGSRLDLLRVAAAVCGEDSAALTEGQQKN